MSTFIAICFHLGYNNRFAQFTPYIDNVLNHCPKTDIYITYREQEDPTTMCHAKYPNAIVMKATQGCDTGAFLLQIKMMLESHKKYDYIFKIHTKSSNPVFPHWTEELLDKIAGSEKSVKKVLESFKKDKKIGMIGCKKWILQRDIKFPIFLDTCRRSKISLDGHFVGGTIFWVKFSIIKETFKHIDIDSEYSLCESGKPTEPSYTHSWERIFGLMVHTQNYQIHGF